MSCGLLDLPCHVQSVADSFIGLFPYGVLGVAFTAGLIVGAVVGKWGVAALVALVVAVRFGSGSDHPIEVPDEDPKPVRKPAVRKDKPRVRTIFDAFRK